jgi:hypothetical protein
MISFAMEKFADSAHALWTTASGRSTAARMGNRQRAAVMALQIVGARRGRLGRGRAVWGTHHEAHRSSGSGGAAGRLG